MTLGRAEILELLAANDVRPSRALGQNFVADGNTVRRIVRLSGVGPGQRVVEIGAGLGSLTLALAEAGASVTAVEIDRHVLPVLRAQVEPVGVRVVEADALTLDWPGLLDGPPSDRWSMVSNLPYNMAVPLVVRVLEEAPRVASLLVMVQREVGERLVARVGDDAYGAVSVKVAYWATSALVGRVPASVFIPRPRVESVLVRLDRHRADPAHPADPADPADLAGRPRFRALRPAVFGGAGRIRPPSQDAPPVARRHRRGRGVLRGGDPPDGQGRRAVAGGVGAAGGVARPPTDLRTAPAGHGLPAVRVRR